jgi:TrbL/VirB6 plasmid conjugal transfer protein
MFVLLDVDPLLSFGGADSKSGMLTDILSTFTRFIDHGGDKIVAAETGAAGALLGFQLIKMIARAGINKSSVVDALGAFLVSAIWFEVATNAVAVTAAFTTWLGSIGSFVSGGSLDGDIMRDPSKLMGLGFSAMSTIWEKGNSFNPILAFIMSGAYLIAGLAVFACYLSLGVVVVFVVIDTSIDVLLGLTLLPFIVEPRSAFLAIRGLFLITDAGMLLGKTSLAAGLSYGFLKNITLQPDPTIRDALNLVAATFICAKLTGQLANVGKGAKAAAGAIF